jgi:hypothetical protein
VGLIIHLNDGETMSKTRKWFRLVAFLPLLSAPGCATITTKADPDARQAGVAGGTRVYLRGKAEGVRVYYEDGTPLRVMLTNDPTLAQALGNELSRVSAEQRGAATYTETMRQSPTIFLNQKQKTHKLRLVRADGSTVLVTREGKLGKRYLAVDWVLFAPTLGLSIGIDWMTGRWRMFESINVDEEFQRAAASGASR